MARKKVYGVGDEKALPGMAAPSLPYRPLDPESYRSPIALIGCGGITAQHLLAYKRARYNVVALCDIDVSRAEARRLEFFPEARVYTDASEIMPAR